MEGYVGVMKANKEKSDAVTEQQNVPNEEASVELIGALKDRHGNQLLVVWLCGLPKERIKSSGGP
jgi:hypothetical protein